MIMRSESAPLFLAGAAAYLLFLGWSMVNVSYDTWGALVVAPVIVGITVPVLRRSFNRRSSYLFPIALAGLGAKLVGSLFRYWVAFDAYGGKADAQLYHETGKLIAADIRSGAISPLAAIPHATGTQFINQLTGLVYAMVGSSRLAGFLIFGWMGFWGAYLFLRAALLAIPGLKTRRYAYLVFLTPSLIYWPSSIGKEAWMLLCLGVASYGAARLFVGRWGAWSVPVTVIGIAGAGFPRPHFAAIWAGSLLLALFASLIIGTGKPGASDRVVTAALIGVSVVGLVIVASATLRFLDPRGEQAGNVGVADRVNNIFASTELNSQQGGSAITPVNVKSPLDWPFAIGRTVTRPLLFEARSAQELFPALEMSFLVAMAALYWKRSKNLPHMLRRNAYVVFSVLILLMFGVAFANIANLGILTRQRSLVLPMLFVPLCIPRRHREEPGMSRVRVRSTGHFPSSLQRSKYTSSESPSLAREPSPTTPLNRTTTPTRSRRTR